MSLRHSRQRSSVSVKKRISLVQDQNGYDIHDNALSTNGPSNDYFSLGSPYPEKQNEEDRRMESLYDIDTEWSNRQDGLIAQADEMTTRSELDLFGSEEEEESRSTSTTSSAPAPAVPPKQVPSTPLKDASDLYTRSPAPSSIDRMTPSRQNSLSGVTSTARNMAGGKKLSLLSGGSVLSQSPSMSPSPSSSRTITPVAAQNKGQSTLRKLQPVKRISLSYVSSPVSKTTHGLPGSASYDVAATTTPSTAGNSMAHTSSTCGYFGRPNGNNPDTPNLASTGSFASTSTSTSPLTTRHGKKEDGDTVMAQHRDVLGRIAEKERRILDIKEVLAKEEEELGKLKSEWQTSVNRELISSRPAAADVNCTIRERKQKESKVDENDQNTVNVASEGWKAISARLAGAGTQLNAFIDQLAIPPPEEDASKAGAGLDVLQEESEEVVHSRQIKKSVRQAGPSRQASVSSQSKRASMFSMAGIQKQVQAQFGAVNGNSPTDGKATNGDAGGWGTWQKRLKEARENATGLLAKAEAKIGQALTMDDLNPSPNTSNNAELHQGNNLIDFSGENDREKAALAELSWLNSLAGINMSGTTDRVTTSRSPDLQASIEPDADRRISSSSGTSKTTNTTPTTTIGPASPSISSISEDSKRDSNGFFSLLGINTNSSDQSASLHKRQSSNGNTKTRMAVKMAMQDRGSSGTRREGNRSSLPPAQDSNADDEEAWGV